MNMLAYFAVMAAAMMGLSQVLPGFRVSGWIPAAFASLILAALNTVLKPILFVLTLPLILLTLGLFLIVLNALILWMTAMIVPGFVITNFSSALIASLILAVVSMAWKSIVNEKGK
jgi:putative membrane protein